MVKPANTNIEAKLRNLVAQTGVKLHGVGITSSEPTPPSPNLKNQLPEATVRFRRWVRRQGRPPIHPRKSLERFDTWNS